MTITRIFRIQIIAELRHEFEEKFASVSVLAVNEASGFISLVILKPTKWTPDDYAMISLWENEASLQAFAGEEWKRAVIPPGMERFVVECSVHHYESWAEET
jgi:heme-degrading monooxygenase HmoA